MDSSCRPVVAHMVRGYLTRTETFIGNQINALRHFQPIVLCHHRLTGHGYPSDDVIAANEYLPTRQRWLDEATYRFARMLTPPAARVLTQALIARRAQLIHFHYLVDARFFLDVKRKTKLPAMISVYGYDVSSFPKWYSGYGRFYLEPLFGEIEMFVAMSLDMRRDLIALGCPEEKIVVHYHGADTRRFVWPERVYADKDEINVLICGTLEAKKSQHLVLAALRQVERRGLSRRAMRVTLVGDGPMRAYLERQVVEYGWQNRVTFMGHIPHQESRLVDVYRQADIFSLPSVTVKGDKEGIPGTIVEAMASGLPVISTHHAGIPEIIETGRDGLLVREGDVEAMSRVFADLMNDPALRERLGRTAAVRATTELDLQQRIVNLEAIYRRVLEDG